MNFFPEISLSFCFKIRLSFKNYIHIHTHALFIDALVCLYLYHLGPLAILGQTVPCCGAVLPIVEYFAASLANMHLMLVVPTLPHCDNQNISRHCQISPLDIAKTKNH